MDYTWYTSVTGIVAATVLGVGVLKRLLATVPYLNCVPTWIFGVAVSFVLTALTNLVWHTLPGDFWQLAMQAVGLAAAATGFYEWYGNITKPLGASDTALKARGLK